MIISFDGNVFAGKSTLIKALSQLLSMSVIGEQGDFLAPHAPKYTLIEHAQAVILQNSYLDAEEKRCSFATSDTDHLLDRSFISMAAHVSALAIMSGIDIREWFLAEFGRRLKTGKALVPDIFCFVRCAHDLIRKRAISDTARGTESLYYDERYLTAVDRFNEAWAARAGGIIIDMDTASHIGLVQTLIQQKKLSSQGPYSVKKICGFLRDILMQGNVTKRGGI